MKRDTHISSFRGSEGRAVAEDLRKKESDRLVEIVKRERARIERNHQARLTKIAAWEARPPKISFTKEQVSRMIEARRGGEKIADLAKQAGVSGYRINSEINQAVSLRRRKLRDWALPLIPPALLEDADLFLTRIITIQFLLREIDSIAFRINSSFGDWGRAEVIAWKEEIQKENKRWWVIDWRSNLLAVSYEAAQAKQRERWEAEKKAAAAERHEVNRLRTIELQKQFMKEN